MGRVKGGGKPSTAKKKPATKKPVRKLARKGPAPVDFEPPFEPPAPPQRPQGGTTTKLSDETLTTKHIHFCRRYAAHGNASKAAREAGFSEDWATWALKQDVLLRRITEYRKLHQKKFALSAERVIEELCRIAFGNLQEFILLDDDGTPHVQLNPDAGEAQMASIREIEQEVYQEKVGQDQDGPIFEPVKRTKIKTHDKIKALELLGRNLRLWDAEEGGDMSPAEKAKRIRDYMRKMAEADGEVASV